VASEPLRDELEAVLRRILEGLRLPQAGRGE
jgi:hypothetical protein